MTPTQAATLIRYKTRTNEVTFTDAQILALGNNRIDEMSQVILKTDEDILLIPQTEDLVASSITAREYALPSDILARIKRVEAKLDGTTWIPLVEIDITEIGISVATESNIINAFNNGKLSVDNPNGARYDLARKALYIYSGTITATTDGLKLRCKTWMAHPASMVSDTDMSVDPSTTTHGMPRELHNMYVTGVVIDYKTSRQQPIPLTERELAYEVDLRKAIETLRHGNLDREIIGHLPSASERGNEGEDY